MSDIAIKVNNVSKSFKIHHQQYEGFRDYFFHMFEKREQPTKFQALEEISFDVKKGEFVGIIGRNGSGKSTLLKIISGIFQPDTGEIVVNGRMTPFLELGVGFNPNLSARENVFLNGVILGLTKKQLEEKYDEIIDFAEVREFQDMPLKTFSSGMQVRLAFSIAIQTDADIYILDEILAVGDANFQAKSLTEFRKFKEKKKTVILVSHDIGSIQQYCNRVVYLKDHKVEAFGITSEVIGKYIYSDRDKTPKEDVNQKKERKDENENNYAKVEKVEFFDKNNTTNEIFISGDPLKIKITYRVKQVLKKPVFGIAMYRDDNYHLFGDNSFISETYDKETIEPGIYTVEIYIPKLPIIRGNVLMSVAITDNTYQTTYIWEDKKYGFNVVSSRPQQGLVLMEPKWKVIKYSTK